MIKHLFGYMESNFHELKDASTRLNLALPSCYLLHMPPPNWQHIVNESDGLVSDVSPSQSHYEMTTDAFPDNDTPMQFVDQSDEMLNLPSTSIHQEHISYTCTYGSVPESFVSPEI